MRHYIPIKLPSLLNTRLHWRKVATLKKKQKAATKVCLKDMVVPPLPILVTITRIGPRQLDDDNLAAACKYVRDEIARIVGVDDGSDLYTWRYEQARGMKYGVNVEVVMR